FVPGEDVPIAGVRRLLPGHVASWKDGRRTVEPYFSLKEEIDPRLEDRATAVKHIRSRCRPAATRRLKGESEVGLLLPGGVDPVTAPQYLLGRAASEDGLAAVFNGEGGDQLFGGWTSKPMISAEIYADLFGEDSREELYLRSYHRFYGREERLYTPEFRAQVGGPGQRRALLRPYLEDPSARTFLNRVRLADIYLKGMQNILPRAERMSNAWGLDMRVPLFDRALAEASFRLPPRLKLHGATEKYVLKLVLQKKLPREIVWRRKFGMSVPITDWALGPLAPLVDDLLGADSLRRRGLFQDGYVGQLRRGQNEAAETRRRRLGERLWTLAMLEAWL